MAKGSTNWASVLWVFFSFIFESGEEGPKGWGLGLGELDSECDQNVLCEILK